MAKIQDKEHAELFEYEQFCDKFRPKKTTDDCYTPDNIYQAVKEWTCRRYGIDQDTVVRPFWPGADFTRTEYPDGCTVIDNPPFSILTKILQYYQDRAIRFLLFCPALVVIDYYRHNCTAICTGVSITYANGACISTSFITNLEDFDLALTTAPDLSIILEKENKLNESKKTLVKVTLPDAIITAAQMNKLSANGIDYSVRRSEAIKVKYLDNYKRGIYGSGLLLSERAAAERAVAERAVAERAAPHKIELSEREKELQRMIGAAK